MIHYMLKEFSQGWVWYKNKMFILNILYYYIFLRIAVHIK